MFPFSMYLLTHYISLVVVWATDNTPVTAKNCYLDLFIFNWEEVMNRYNNDGALRIAQYLLVESMAWFSHLEKKRLINIKQLR